MKKHNQLGMSFIDLLIIAALIGILSGVYFADKESKKHSNKVTSITTEMSEEKKLAQNDNDIVGTEKSDTNDKIDVDDVPSNTKFWPFGQATWFCDNVVPSAYTNIVRDILVALARCGE